MPFFARIISDHVSHLVAQQRCSEDHAKLAEMLAARDVKAYLPNVSVNDPKQRKPANEVSDWCAGEGMKLWSTKDHRPLASLSMNGRRLVSIPTNNMLQEDLS